MNGPGEQVRRPARAPKPAPQAPPAHAGASGTASTSAPDPFYGHEETARMCARFISDLFHCPDTAAAPPPAQGGAAPTPAAPPLANFIAYALHRTRLHACVTFTALFLLQRLKTRFPAARGSSGHRLFISAFMIASKVVCDDTYSNKSWCVVGQGMFSLKEINQMEREMCSYLEWKLNFVPSELAEFEVKVRREFTRTGRPAVPPIVTAAAPAGPHQHQSGKGSLPSPPDSPNTPASSHSMNPSPQSDSVVTPPSDDATSIASSKTASSMFSSASASTLATSMASSSISGHGAQQQQQQQQQQHPGGKTGGEPGFAFATRSVW